MEPALTWLDLTASDRDRMRRVPDLFKEQGTVDEMGLGSLRDTLSDAPLPGTSYIQTRLRYVLFIPCPDEFVNPVELHLLGLPPQQRLWHPPTGGFRILAIAPFVNRTALEALLAGR